MGPDDVKVAEGWTEASRPRSTGSSRDEYRQVLALLIGPVFVAFGIWFAWGDAAARIHFDGVSRAAAVVVSAEYVKPTLKEDASAIVVDVRTASGLASVSIDHPLSAPDGLSAGDRVTVLFDPAHPGDAIFPSQLGWGKVLPGLGFTVVGLTATVAGALATVRTVRGRRTAMR
ncbi:DUF3592 domain-containing protein [Streptacidiphilus sp. PAMC 29251]